MSYKHAVAIEKTFMWGTGANQPLGIFTPSVDGINTDRDIEGGTTTAITGDGLIDVLYSLKPQYTKSATWIFHRDAVAQIRKIKNVVDGHYIWQPGLSGNVPQTILDRPFVISEYAPNTFTSAKYVGIIGDFRFYWWALALQMQIQRLIELYAACNQTGFIGRIEIDGQPVLSEAFARVKLHT